MIEKNICMIIGDPVMHSLSPYMHNEAYRQMHIDDRFVYVAANVNAKDLGTAISGIVALHIKGVTVTVPHKVAVMQYVHTIDPIAKKIGAVNTIVNCNDTLKGYNTDWIGVLNSLKAVTQIQNKHVAIIGAGGFARAAVYAITTQGGKVTVFNRTVSSAKKIADEFNCLYASLHDMVKIKNMDIIINASSVGLSTNETIVPSDVITSAHIVLDAVYVPFETKLLQDAKAKGATIIHGTEILLHQGIAQFEIFTGEKAPEDCMRKIILQNI